MSNSPNQHFTQSEDMDGFKVTVEGDHDGQAIVIHASGNEFLAVGYHSQVSWNDPAFTWPKIKDLRVERVVWNRDHWDSDGEPDFSVDQSHKILSVDLDSAQAVRVSW